MSPCFLCSFVFLPQKNKSYIVALGFVHRKICCIFVIRNKDEDMAQPLAERLRPKTLDDYIGQKHLVGPGAVLRKMIDAGRISSFILWGPPGVGKTTLAQIIANKLETPFYTLSAVTSGVKDVRDVIEKARSNRFFSQASPILFIDEIHRLNRVVEEILYPAMEDFAIDIMIGKGPTARSIRVAVPKFTLVGATTRAGQLSAPLRDRFGILFRLEMYKPEELAQIVRRSASILEIDAEDAGIMEIARRSRGTPRIANRMLKRVRDYAQVRGGGVISLDVAREAIAMQGVDELGLDKVDRAVLGTMMDKFGGGPVGLDTLAATTGEDAVTIEDVYEPYLMQLGFLMRTPRGRMCTPTAWEHMKRTPPGQGNDNQLKMEL